MKNLNIIFRTTSILLFLFCLSTNNLKAEDSKSMTGKDLENIITELAKDEYKVEDNVIEFKFKETLLICIYVESYNRMRIISPISNYNDVTRHQKDRMMEANFHSALDARYAVSQDILYSAFIHPLDSLKKVDVLSAIYQVTSLHKSFGTDYSSGLLGFGETREEATDLI